MKLKSLSLILTVSLLSQQTFSDVDRTVLPIVEPEAKSYDIMDVRQAQKPPFFEVKAPAKAPNVVIVLIDDFGFGQSSTFGGPINMPTLQNMAKNGIKYNRFHTTALCSPTRAALLSGRNHHAANTGSVMETSTAFPGNTGIRPNSVAPVAEILRLNGFNTAAFGKSHETPPWQISISGPYNHWPTGSGFEKFYGFLGGETNQWAPALYDGTNKIEMPKDPNYHLTNDLANKAISWMKGQQALTPDKPFFVYFAPGATHAPHHAPKEWISKYKGKFDQGWDKLREETFARQKALGIVPQSAELTLRPKEISAWDSYSSEEKKLLAHQMETFAGFAEHTDHEVGRIADALQEIGELENTLFFYIAGDNGASGEGGPNGTYNELLNLNGMNSTAAQNIPFMAKWGNPETYPHYSVGWAHAGNTPFQWTKQVASHFGGTRNGMVVHWPNGLKNKNEIRSQFHHATDIAPTILEAAGLPEPKRVNGADQRKMDGVSMLYSFNDPKAKDKRETQYFEMFGNRAIYHKGWVAGTRHSIPWQLAAASTPFDEDTWELYNINDDFTQASDLAKKNPQKLQELQKLFLAEAERNHVLPMDDRRAERANPELAGRPDLMAGRKVLTLYQGMTGLGENIFVNVKNKSYILTSEVELPSDKVNGVIISQGGKFGGWTLFMKNGKAFHEYNFFGAERTQVSSPSILKKGKHTITYHFEFQGEKPGEGGVGRLYIDSKMVSERKLPKTVPFLFSTDEGVDVGVDNETNVSNAYKQQNNKFQGKILKVIVDIDPLHSQQMKENLKQAQEDK
jgi:arylsulfatase A-like enzyme